MFWYTALVNIFAHNGGFNTGEPEGLSHVIKDNGVAAAFVSVVFIATVYGFYVYLTKNATRNAKPKEGADKDA